MRPGATVTLKIPPRFVHSLWSTASRNFYREQQDRFEILDGETQGTAKIAKYHLMYRVGDNAASLLLLAGYLEATKQPYACLWDLATLEYAIVCDTALDAPNQPKKASLNALKPKRKRTPPRK